MKRAELELKGRKRNGCAESHQLLSLVASSHKHTGDVTNMVYFPVRQWSFKSTLHRWYLQDCPTGQRVSDRFRRAPTNQRSDCKYFIPGIRKQLRRTFVEVCSVTTVLNLRSRTESVNSVSPFQGSSICLFLFRRSMQTKGQQGLTSHEASLKTSDSALSSYLCRFPTCCKDNKRQSLFLTRCVL